jgi:hypothetical protein
MPITGASCAAGGAASGRPSSAPQSSQIRKLPFWPAQKAANWKWAGRSRPGVLEDVLDAEVAPQQRQRQDQEASTIERAKKP